MASTPTNRGSEVVWVGLLIDRGLRVMPSTLGGRGSVGRTGMRVGLDHPLLLAAAPAIGYLVAYLDRLGEALFYGIPVDYIQLSVTDALSRTSLVVVAALMLQGTARLKSLLERRLPNWLALAVDTGTNWLLFAGLILVLAGNLRFALAVLVTGLFYVVVDTLWGFWRRHRKAPTPDARPDGLPLLAKKAEPSPLAVRLPVLIALTVAMLFFSMYGGNMRAASRQRYLVSSDDPSVVLLAMYGADRAVLGVIRDGGPHLTDSRRFVSIADERAEFVWTDTGALSWRAGVSLMPGLERYK